MIFSENNKEMIAWNGVRFLIPKNWQVGIVGKQYLLLEMDTGPVMELKWNRIKGRFSHKNQLRRLSATRNRKAVKTLKICPLPAEWKDAVKGYESEAFFWHGKGDINGNGVLLYCPSCCNATFIQFFNRGPLGNKGIQGQILGSFKDHHEKHLINYHIFNIKAVIPDHFRLLRYKFDAGKYALEFMSKSQKLVLNRWGASSVILRDRSLIDFANSLLDAPGKGLPSRDSGQHLNWSIEPSSYPGAGLIRRIKTRYPFQMSRVWQEESSNSIFSVNIKGKHPIDSNLFQRICSDYESI